MNTDIYPRQMELILGQSEFLSINKVADIFGGPHLKSVIEDLEREKRIPIGKKIRVGALQRKGWSKSAISLIGSEIGFFKQLPRAASICVFTTKGGVLKSTLALNLARVAALHGLKTCVVGLDIQGDVTTALGHESEMEDQDDLKELIAKLNRTQGLSDLFAARTRLRDIIVPTDLDNLFLIPETPELVALNDGLNNINRREFWLKEKVIDRLKDHFDLVVMDCSPNWNRLTTNALVAADVLVSPLECKINNFRNFKVFRQFLKEFRDDMHLDLQTIFVPTRYSKNKKLSMDIFNWYQENVPGCTTVGLRESVISEEATALHLSLLEHRPNCEVAEELRNILSQIHERLSQCLVAPARILTPSERATNLAPSFHL